AGNRERSRAQRAALPDRALDRARRSFHRTEQGSSLLLYLAYNGPYGLGNLLKHPGRNRHVDYYSDKPLFSFPRDAMHPWLFNNKAFLNNPISIRRVAAETSGVDDGVGEIMATLKRLDLDRDTLVVYAGDQGWMGGQNGFWGMGDHTRPTGAH